MTWAAEYADQFLPSCSALSVPLGEWQSTGFTSGHNVFFQMCDAVQGFAAASLGSGSAPNATSRTVTSLSAEAALANFARWFKTRYLPGCESCPSTSTQVCLSREFQN